MRYFPLFIQLEGKRCVLAGGGPVAARKGKALLSFGAALTIVAPAYSEEVKALAEQGGARVRLKQKTVEPADLDGADLVIAATDEEAVNRWICERCRKLHIPVNDAGNPENGNVLFPGLVEAGDVTIGISTGGNSPAAAAFLRKELEGWMPRGLEETVRLLGQLRGEIRMQTAESERSDGQKQRAGNWDALFAYCMEREGRVSLDELRACWTAQDGKRREEQRREEPGMERQEKMRIGTRGSRLALAQEQQTEEALRKAFPELETACVIRKTRGDRILDRPFADIGDKGLFAAEFETALQEREIDAAVHSAKDLPMQLAEGLCIAAVLPRADVRDVLVLRKDGRTPQDSASFVLGTGSRRRASQAERLWPGVLCRSIRGNVETRLQKLETGEYDGILLAKAGLDRLHIGEETHPQFRFLVLDPEEFLPAACQGIIAVETREGGEEERLLGQISDAKTHLAFWVERQVLDLLGADCSEPAGAWCREEGGALVLDVMYGDERCRRSEAFSETALSREAQREIGRRLAEAAAKEVRMRQR